MCTLIVDQRKTLALMQLIMFVRLTIQSRQFGRLRGMFAKGYQINGIAVKHLHLLVRTSRTHAVYPNDAQ